MGAQTFVPHGTHGTHINFDRQLDLGDGRKLMWVQVRT